MNLPGLLEELGDPGSSTDDLRFRAIPILGHGGFFAGWDGSSHACILIEMPPGRSERRPPIRLESLDTQFAVSCRVESGDGACREGLFTVVRCRSTSLETTRYFLLLCETLVRVLGEWPTAAAVAESVHHLAAILREMSRPPVTSLLGLFGEVLLIHQSQDPITLAMAWRVDDSSRFDFSLDSLRVEVKTSGRRQRSHVFSYDQCNPPEGTSAIVASLFGEVVARGTSLRSLLADVESRISAEPDLVYRMYQTVARTAGSAVSDALDTEFDIELALSTIEFFNLRSIPAIRDALPPHVSSVHFTSDLDAGSPLSCDELTTMDARLAKMLARRGPERPV